jgi:hypothetical protein
VFTIFAVWMSLGPGRGPYGLFFRFVPGYDGLRAPARFAGVAMLGLGALAAVNLAAAVRGIRRPAARATVCAAALAALVTEYWSAPRQMRFAPAPKPAYDWLRAAPPGPVIEFPVPRREADMWREAVYEFYSTRHWRPLFNGYSGYSPPDYRVACRYLDSFPDSVSVSVLRHFGIRYAVVHRCNDRKAREIGKWLEPAASFGSDRVFTVPAAPAGTPPRAGLSGRGILPSGAWAVAAVSPHKPGAAAALRDSDSGTGWEAAADGDSEASLDLAFVRSVRPAALRLHFGARATAFPRRLRVLARGDDGAWREIGFNQDPLDFVASATERPRDPVMDIALAASPPGPLRLVLADGDPAWGIYVADIEVFARSRQER